MVKYRSAHKGNRGVINAKVYVVWALNQDFGFLCNVYRKCAVGRRSSLHFTQKEALSGGEAVRKLTSREGFNIHGPIQPDPARSNSPQFTSLDRDSKHSEDIEYVLSHWAG